MKMALALVCGIFYGWLIGEAAAKEKPRSRVNDMYICTRQSLADLGEKYGYIGNTACDSDLPAWVRERQDG